VPREQLIDALFSVALAIIGLRAFAVALASRGGASEVRKIADALIESASSTDLSEWIEAYDFERATGPPLSTILYWIGRSGMAAEWLRRRASLAERGWRSEGRASRSPAARWSSLRTVSITGRTSPPVGEAVGARRRGWPGHTSCAHGPGSSRCLGSSPTESPELLDDPERVLAARPRPGPGAVDLAPALAEPAVASGSTR
jgi:hypothetical protein